MVDLYSHIVDNGTRICYTTYKAEQKRLQI